MPAGVVLKRRTRLVSPHFAALVGLVIGVIAGSSAVRAEAKYAALAIDANTGATLYAVAADDLRRPASLTKMMTLYLVFEAIEQRRLSFSTRLKISQEAASAAPSKLDLEPGEEISVMDAVRALIVKSANDVAVAVAEHLAGSEPRFAALMTARAQALGMTRTVFKNASGLPHPQQVTTARDMLTLALRLQDDFPGHYPLFATRGFTFQGAHYRSHNGLLATMEGVDGIKTGYTRKSGFNLVTSLRQEHKHLVGAILGGPSPGVRNAHMRAMLTRAMLRASTRKTRRAPVAAPVLVAAARPAVRPPKPVRSLEPVAPALPLPAVASALPSLPAPRTIEALIAATSEPDAPGEAAPAFAVDVAKVRRVMVAPRPRPSQAFAENPLTPAAPSRSAEARIGAFAPPVIALAAVADDEQDPPAWQPAAPVPGRRPSTLADQAMALGATVPPLAPAPPIAEVTPPIPVPVQVAARPTPVLATPAALRSESAQARGHSGFHIQIGAFASLGEAESTLANTRTRAGTLLASASPLTAPVAKDNRQLYRARFAGFDARSAASTCLALRRLAIDCFVMKAE